MVVGSNRNCPIGKNCGRNVVLKLDGIADSDLFFDCY